jgi:hypothetical protein
MEYTLRRGACVRKPQIPAVYFRHALFVFAGKRKGGKKQSLIKRVEKE